MSVSMPVSMQWKRVAQAVTVVVMEKRLSKRGGGSFSNTRLDFSAPMVKIKFDGMR